MTNARVVDPSAAAVASLHSPENENDLCMILYCTVARVYLILLCPLTAKMNERNEIGYPSEVHPCLYEIHPGKGVNCQLSFRWCEMRLCVCFPSFPQTSISNCSNFRPAWMMMTTTTTRHTSNELRKTNARRLSTPTERQR